MTDFNDMNNKLNEKTYKELIGEDISVLNKHLPNCLEREHIESVLKNSIDRYYPNYQALKIADDLILQLFDYVKTIIAGSCEIDGYDKNIMASCLEYIQLRNLKT